MTLATLEGPMPPPTAEPILELSDVTFGYPRAEPVLRGVDLRVPAGASVALMGANGSGKTTLLRVIAGLLHPRSGTVAVRTKRIGYIPQQVGLVSTLSARRNVLLGALSRASPLDALRGRFAAADESEADRLLWRVGLSRKRNEPVHRLSGGERRRVAIARALLARPRLLLADEFVAHLDILKAGELLELLRGFRSEGMTLVVALHDLVLAKEFADRIAFVKDGRVAAVVPSGHATPEHMRWYLAHS